jgi:hypothetical protein
MKILNDKSKELLLQKLAGMSSETNKSVYEFTVVLFEELGGVDWAKSGGKMNFLNELVEQPSIYIKDSGCLRHMQNSGKFIKLYYDNDIDKLSAIGYWTFHNISRSRLSADDVLDIKRKKDLIERLISGDLKEGKVKAEINKIKDREFPKALEESLQWFNVWNFLKLDRRFGIEHPGQIPGQILINIIYHYMNKNAVIVDPMAGGGTTKDVCDFFNDLPPLEVDLFRDHPELYELKCHSFDLDPKREFVVKKDALNDGWGILNADLVFLDPPYFSMMKDGYVKNEFTKSRESFYNAIDVVVNKSFEALKVGGLCALIIQPQTEKDLMPGEVCIDLPFECYKIMEKYFTPYQRIQVALSTQQFNATDIKKVQLYRNKHRLLGISRDLIIMRKD